MIIRITAILSILFVSAANLTAGMNILVLGSTHSFSESEKLKKGSQKAFNAAAVADSLRAILAEDPNYSKNANVVFEDIYRTKILPTAIGGGGKMMSMEYRCHSLAQYYFWPDQLARRIANLSGRGKTRWNYVVIVGDPYIIANMPGVYAEGVNLIAGAVRRGAGRPILLAHWPAGASSSAAHFAQVAYRVGKGLRIPVAPAGYAWSTLSGKDGKKSTVIP